MTRRTHESFFEAEREARRLTPYVVVEVRSEEDPPGVEAVFVVCPESEAKNVPGGREVVFTAGDHQPTVAQLRSAMLDALGPINRVLGWLCAEAPSETLDEARRILETGLYGSAISVGRGQ